MIQTFAEIKAVRIAILLTTIGAFAGCREDKTAAPKICCEQPEIPKGVANFKIIADEVDGMSDAAKVKIKAVLSADVQRDGVYPVLHTLYRHAMTRTAFEPISFEALLFKAGDSGANPSTAIASIERPRGQMAPACDNKIPYEFEKSAQMVFGEIFRRKAAQDPTDTCRIAESRDEKPVDEGFSLRPQMQLDVENRIITITYPYTRMGEDAYVDKLRYSTALREWIDYTTQIFRKVPNVNRVDFVGRHNDQDVLRIGLTKEDFGSGFSTLLQEISAHAAVTFQKMGTNAAGEKEAMKDQEDFYKKTFRAALANLPKSQVTLANSLK